MISTPVGTEKKTRSKSFTAVGNKISYHIRMVKKHATRMISMNFFSFFIYLFIYFASFNPCFDTESYYVIIFVDPAPKHLLRSSNLSFLEHLLFISISIV